MTLGRFLATLGRKWFLFLIPLTLGLVSFYLTTTAPMQYEATARVSVADHLSTANVLAAKAVDETHYSGVTLWKYCNMSQRQVVLAADGESADQCVQAVNAACEKLQEIVAETDSNVTVISSSMAKKAKQKPHTNKLFWYMFAAILIGLLIAVVILLLLEKRRNNRMTESGRNSGNDSLPATPKRIAQSAVAPGGQERASKSIRVVLYHAFALAIAISTNALVFLIGGFNFAIRITTLVIFLAIVVPFWAKHPISKRFLVRWSWWILLTLGVYCLVGLATQHFGGVDYEWLMTFMVIMPLVVHVARRQGDFDNFIEALPNVMAALGAASLVLWIIGPVLGLIEPNCTIEDWWGPMKGAEVSGYFHLLYRVQSDSLLLPSIARNTGIYPESPMYAYALLSALCFELFLTSEPRKIIVAIISLTIVSSTSTTGIALLAVIFIVLAVMKLPRKALLILAPVGLLCIGAAGFALWSKVMGNSGMTHIDDFQAAFRAWLDSPLIGCGFENRSPIRGYMSDFRYTNTGQSNSLGYVLATGGIAFLSVYVYAFAGYFWKSSRKMKISGTLLFVSWAVTWASKLFLTALILAIGIENLCSDSPTDQIEQAGTDEPGEVR